MTFLAEFAGVISIGFALASLIPYLWLTLSKKIKPHIFTWALWSFETGAAFAVQYISGAGPGAWATAVTCLFCCLIAIAALCKGRGDKYITKSDWVALVAALGIIPLWITTKNPTYAAIWITAIDMLAYYPTFRKAWFRPYEEMASSRLVAAAKHVFALIAMHNFSIATALYPASLIVMNGLLFGTIMGRRKVIKRL